MIQIYFQSNKFILFLFTLVLLFSPICHAQKIKNLEDLATLQFNNEAIQITAPYSILANTKYTPKFDSFTFQQYAIKIVDQMDPDNFVLTITKNPKLPHINNASSLVENRLPWWSKSAPSILKSLDFSEVDGSLDEYKIGKHHRLKLLGNQGTWGKVYALEHLDNISNPTKICAVKVLLTRKDRFITDVQEFRKRHIEEINKNFILLDRNIDIGVTLYGMLKQNDDHYLVFSEFGQNASDIFKNQSKELSSHALYDLLIKINKLHLAGISHGDLYVGNMLFFGKSIKLCDWYSLNDFTKMDLKQYRFDGYNLAPEAIRAFYFGDKGHLNYAIVNIQGKKQAYLLHPISADRFCLGIGLLEILAPDLYQPYHDLNTKDFNPWAPKSLDFWAKHVDYIKRTQSELLKRALKADDWKLAELYRQTAQFIALDPMKRDFILNEKIKN